VQWLLSDATKKGNFSITNFSTDLVSWIYDIRPSNQLTFIIIIIIIIFNTFAFLFQFKPSVHSKLK
jgi:hypothetical protein